MCQDLAAPAALALLHDTEMQPGCSVEAVQPHWQNEAYILGPVATAMMIPLSPRHLLSRTNQQQQAVERAGKRLGAFAIHDREDYYPGAWTAIATLTLDGVLPKLAPALARLAVSAGEATAPDQEGSAATGWTGSRCPVIAPEAPRLRTPTAQARPHAAAALEMPTHEATALSIASAGAGGAPLSVVAVVVTLLGLGLLDRRRRARHRFALIKEGGSHQLVSTITEDAPMRDATPGPATVVAQFDANSADREAHGQADDAPLLNERVCIFGLAEARELNGRAGNVVSFDASEGRYWVDVLDVSSDNVVDRVALRACNVEVDEPYAVVD